MSMSTPEKRAFDLRITRTIGAIGLGVGVLTASFLTVANGTFPLFRQERVGRREEEGDTFTILKLLTLDEAGNHLRGARLARKVGLDETPQFLNVLAGTMTVSSYRPLVVEDENKAVKRLRQHFLPGHPCDPDNWIELRRQCLPGITGPAQIMPKRPDAGSLDHLAEVVKEECLYLRLGDQSDDWRYVKATPGALLGGRNPTVERAQATIDTQETLVMPEPLPATDQLSLFDRLTRS